MLHKAGLAVRTIFQAVGRSVGVVQKTVTPPAKSKPLSRRGRVSKLCERTKRQIRRAVIHGSLSSKQVRSKFKLPCSVRTIQRALHDTPWLKYKKCPAGPNFTKCHKDCRIQWANQMGEKNVDWTTMVFSDEKKWNLDGPD
uniref:Transposase Tc1-like domain-containing protein n=1 Tax=Globisporangium ultimum (strain ATCC 200006 / CBS 805.95 / DAOM BR144) TaxID=431595 RepID=K3X7Y9_GLOUD